jgi:phosphate transport system permease protein
MNQQSFTGHSRRRKTRWSVHVIDRLAHGLIATGGIGTIVAVLLVCVFLVWVALPLFWPASVSNQSVAKIDWSADSPRHITLDEDQLLGYALLADGSLLAFRPDTGERVSQQEFLRAEPPTATAFDPQGVRAALGFQNGSVRLANIQFITTFVEQTEVPEQVRKLRPGDVIVFDEALWTRAPAGQFRQRRLVAELEAPIEIDGAGAIQRIDYSARPSGEMFCVLSAGGRLELYAAHHRENLLTGETIVETTGSQLPWRQPENMGLPDFLLLSDQGDHVFAAWPDGTLLDFDTRDFDHPKLGEQLDLVPEADGRLTALRFLLGKGTLLAGDSLGRVQAWFGVHAADKGVDEPVRLVKAHVFVGPPSKEGAATPEVRRLASSGNSRLFSVAYSDGSVRMYYPTNERLVLDTRAPAEMVLEQLTLAPRDNGLLACGEKQLVHWTIDAGYPEASLRALFLPVWYEGAAGPSLVWQSGSGSGGSEPKLSLIPLLYGTVKATFYSLLFGVPLALGAALYTSEFMHPSLRAKIKPAVEMMASLPSVVLGFLAGAIVAPFVEGSILIIVCTVFTIPVTLVAGAYIWQLLPQRLTLAAARWRLAMIFLMLPMGVLLALAVAPWLEWAWFAGDVIGWLDGQVGSGVGGWAMLLAPIVALILGWLTLERFHPRLRRKFPDWPRRAWALIDLASFLVGVAGVLLISWLAGLGLDSLSFDPRGQAPANLDGTEFALGLVGTYAPRNALVVGFVMGFAIIPLIYTIADDALSTVPDHLRSASLGAGATPWQTALRVVVPTAMSGLFSAVMIGLGRAVGETMIVLMAAGNTPIMDWNIFNGFQTLSSLIAQEMPEAVRNSTHYRVLFVAALTLFGLTFVVNTAAEIIRLRFRRRAYEL